MTAHSDVFAEVNGEKVKVGTATQGNGDGVSVIHLDEEHADSKLKDISFGGSTEGIELTAKAEPAKPVKK